MQFMIGFKGIDKFVKIAKTPSLSGKFAKSIATGAGADFIAFDDDVGRLTDIARILSQCCRRLFRLFKK